jgi:hypothetical protein
VQLGEENNRIDIAEAKRNISEVLSVLSPFGIHNGSDFSFAFRLSYSDTIPWQDQSVENSGSGIVIEQRLVHSDGLGAFKKAVLLNEGVRQSAQDASFSAHKLVQQEDTTGEATMDGCFVAPMQLEPVYLDE